MYLIHCIFTPRGTSFYFLKFCQYRLVSWFVPTKTHNRETLTCPVCGYFGKTTPGLESSDIYGPRSKYKTVHLLFFDVFLKLLSPENVKVTKD